MARSIAASGWIGGFMISQRALYEGRKVGLLVPQCGLPGGPEHQDRADRRGHKQNHRSRDRDEPAQAIFGDQPTVFGVGRLRKINGPVNENPDAQNQACGSENPKAYHADLRASTPCFTLGLFVIKLPETKRFAPASLARPMVVGSIPPST